MVFLRVGPWAHSYWLLLPEAMFQLWQEVTTGVGKVWMWFLGPGPAQEAILPLSAWSRDPCPYLDSDPNHRSCPTGACAASQVPTLHAKLLRKFYSTSSLKICCYWVKLFKIHHIIPVCHFISENSCFLAENLAIFPESNQFLDALSINQFVSWFNMCRSSLTKFLKERSVTVH